MMMRRSLAVAGMCCEIVLLAGCWQPGPPPEATPSAQDSAGAASTQDSFGDPSSTGARADAVPRVLRYLPADASQADARAVVVGGHALVFTRQLLSVDAQGNGQVVASNWPPAHSKKVLDDLDAVLSSAGSGLERLVRVHVCADSAETLQAFDEALAERLPPHVRPAITRVVSPLPEVAAMLGVDAVAVAKDAGPAVRMVHCPTAAHAAVGVVNYGPPANRGVAGSPGVADAAVVPWAGMAWFSGRAEKGTAAEAAAKSFGALWKMMDELELEPAQIVQLRVFVDSMSAVDDVRQEIGRRFPEQPSPPVVFVQWIASAPVEIEMAVFLPAASAPSAGEASSVPSAAPLRYYNPPDAKPSPSFSRVAITRADRLVFICGLTSRQPGDGTAQVRDIFSQLEEVLDKAGSDMDHLAKATYYVSDKDASTALDKLRREYYDPQRPPAASKAMVPGLGQAHRSVVIDMIAVPSVSRQ